MQRNCLVTELVNETNISLGYTYIRASGPSGNKHFQIPSGKKFVYSFTKTHDIVYLIEQIPACNEKIVCIFYPLVTELVCRNLLAATFDNLSILLAHDIIHDDIVFNR